MPRTLDILIGLSMVMLVISMVVTVLTQAVTSALNRGGAYLKQGIADLLDHLDAAVTPAVAQGIADWVLRHPLVGETNPITGNRRLGTVIHREELTKLLLEFAAPAAAPQNMNAAHGALRTTLTNNGIANPGQTLSQIRATMMELEKTNPELANNARVNLAILHNADSDFIGKINAWFDQTIDRVQARFTAGTHLITLVIAIVVAVVLQLDTIGLITRLSIDDSLRNRTVQAALGLDNKPPLDMTNPSYDKVRAQLGQLTNIDLVAAPTSFDQWTAGWRCDEKTPECKSGGIWWSKIAGIVVSILLLSLGAPFWYNALKNLLQMRSLIAGKDDSQRQERQTAQAATPTPIGPAQYAAELPRGERGDLAAAG